MSRGAGLLLVTLAGWLWGSFLNQLVDRTPRSPSRTGRQSGPGKAGGSILFRPARSVCFSCGTAIAWHDNIPIASYLLLQGRCRRCGHSIGRRTLVLEIVTPLGVSGVYWFDGWRGAAWGLVVVSAAVLAGGWWWEGRLPPGRWWPALLGAAGAGLALAALAYR